MINMKYTDKLKIKSRVKKRAEILMALYNSDRERAIKLAKQYDESENTFHMCDLVSNMDTHYDIVIVALHPKRFARKICMELGIDGISLYKEIINSLDKYYPELDSIVNKSEKL